MIHLNGERVDIEMARFQIQEKSGCSGERIAVDTWNSLTLIQRIRRIAIGESPWLSALQPAPFLNWMTPTRLTCSVSCFLPFYYFAKIFLSFSHSRYSLTSSVLFFYIGNRISKLGLDF